MSWNIDNSHSDVSFAVRHMMLSTVRGRFEKFSGVVDLDPAHPENTKVDVTVDAASINTKDAKRDDHLRSPDFFNVEAYPNLTFKSKRVELIDRERAKLIGDLTIRDVTREVTLDVEYLGQAKSPWGTTSAGFSVSTKINRKDWGLTWNVALETGGVLVSDDIKVEVEVELVQQPEAESAAAA